MVISNNIYYYRYVYHATLRKHIAWSGVTGNNTMCITFASLLMDVPTVQCSFRVAYFPFVAT